MSYPSYLTRIRKAYLTFRLYGFTRTYIKVFGRIRFRGMPRFPLTLSPSHRTIGIVGCGQFSTSAIGYFLKKNRGNVIAACYDIDPVPRDSFAWYYRCKSCASFDQLITLKNIDLIYIASNHASHTDYALKCLANGIAVFVEKPLSTSVAQFKELRETLTAKPESKIFLGYNRPFAPAIRELRTALLNHKGPITLSCFITGHKLSKDHWYRRPEEGTRICGNVGHWIDLAIHLMWTKELKPETVNIQLTYGDLSEPDDNLVISMASNLGDVVSIGLSSRGEPFEGINETINCQCNDLICKIDDFRRMTLWQNNQLSKRRYFRKDVGHELSVLQPFTTFKRDWKEIEISTSLMLAIAQLVVDKKSHGSVTLA